MMDVEILRKILFEMGVSRAFRQRCSGEVSSLHLHKLHPSTKSLPVPFSCQGTQCPDRTVFDISATLRTAVKRNKKKTDGPT